jgi:hypothetical protein
MTVTRVLPAPVATFENIARSDVRTLPAGAIVELRRGGIIADDAKQAIEIRRITVVKDGRILVDSGTFVADSAGTTSTTGESVVFGGASGSDYGGASAIPFAIGMAIVGALVGAAIGFLVRPSVPLLGQLPFMAVITRGASLQGLDQLLVPIAQSSFDQMVMYGLVGGAIGLAVTFAIRMTRRVQPSAVGTTIRQGVQTVTAPPTADEEVLKNDAVLGMIAAGLGEDVIVEKIKYSRCAFALLSSDLAELKASGASDRIISSMLENQARRGAAHK